VFAIQFRQQPAAMINDDSFKRAIDCAMRTEVAPHLARGRANLVVFDEDIGLETLAAGSRGAKARALLRQGVPSCSGQASPCATLATLSAIDQGYGRALTYLGRTFPKLQAQLGRAFVAATDQFVRTFMTTMADEALRYRRATRQRSRRSEIPATSTCTPCTRQPRAAPMTRPSSGGRASSTTARPLHWPTCCASTARCR
jgi:hypothetical protein